MPIGTTNHAITYTNKFFACSIVDYISLGQYRIKSFNERRQRRDQSENKSVRMPGSEELKKMPEKGVGETEKEPQVK